MLSSNLYLLGVVLDTPEKQQIAGRIEKLVERVILMKNEKLIIGNTPSASLPPLIEGNLSSDPVKEGFDTASL